MPVKQEELELCGQSHGIIGITETWWDSSHVWRIVVDDCRLFCKVREGGRGGVTLNVKENLECVGVNYGDPGSPMECLWAEVVSKVDLTIHICYQPRKQDDKANEARFESLKLQLNRPWFFNYPDVCWKNNIAAHVCQVAGLWALILEDLVCYSCKNHTTTQTRRKRKLFTRQYGLTT